MNSPGDWNLPEEWIDRRDPVAEIIEREEPFYHPDPERAAQTKMIEILNGFAVVVHRALNDPNATLRSVATAFYGPVYSLGLNIADGMSMTERAEQWGMTRAGISKNATLFCRAFQLEPSWYMKTENASITYSEARVESVQRNGAKPLPVPAPRGRSV